MIKKITLSTKALKYIQSKGINIITIDIESFGECCIGISEAVVTTVAPQDETQYDYYREHGIGIYIFKPMQFVGNKVEVNLSGGFLTKQHLIAGNVKLL